MRKFNSHIKVKTCKCGCGSLPTMGWGGYKFSHAPQELKDKQTKKQVERRLRANKAQISRKLHKVANDKGMQISGQKEAVMNSQGHWFEDRRKEMQGFCQNCSKRVDIGGKRWKWSIAHIVPKALIPSVATHKDNWYELCQDCHSEFDNTFDKAAAMPCFEEIKAKFQLFKGEIPPQEMRKINPHLID